MGSYTTRVTESSPIESIQSGVILISSNSNSGTASITGVDLTKATIIPGGKSTSQSSATIRGSNARLELASALVTATREESANYALRVAFTVVEFK